jgi:hypothetical protein
MHTHLHAFQLGCDEVLWAGRRLLGRPLAPRLALALQGGQPAVRQQPSELGRAQHMLDMQLLICHHVMTPCEQAHTIENQL